MKALQMYNMNWQLELNAHWPHDRFALGWEYIAATDEENITTFTIYFLIVTVSFNIYE